VKRPAKNRFALVMENFFSPIMLLNLARERAGLGFGGWIFGSGRVGCLSWFWVGI
jgi:hypothetical protein